MRKILFRAKSLEDDRWEYCYFVSTQYGYIIDDLEGKETPVDVNTVEEYLGTTSKGERVFEGDILSVLSGGAFIKLYGYGIAAIGDWIDRDFVAKLGKNAYDNKVNPRGYGRPSLILKNGGTFTLTPSFIKDSDVIGNVYDDSINDIDKLVKENS